MIDNANVYAYYCLRKNDPEHRAEDAHMWLDVMYSDAKEHSILA